MSTLVSTKPSAPPYHHHRIFTPHAFPVDSSSQDAASTSEESRDSPTHSSSKAGGGRSKGRGLTCLQCRKSKVKCSRTLPSCQRCLRLGLSCHFEDQSKKRKNTSVLIPYERAFRVKTTEGWQYLNCCVMGAMIKTFFELYDKGLVVPQRALTVLRCMAEEAEAHKYQPMQMAVGVMAKAFNVPSSRHIIEDPELHRKLSKYTDNHHEHHVPEATGAEMLPRRKLTLHDIPFFLKEYFHDPQWACTIIISQDGEHNCYTNELFSRMFFPIPGCPPPAGTVPMESHYSNSHLHIFSRHVHPMDRERVSKAYSSMVFGAPTNPAGISEVVRWWNSQGQLCMGLLRLRAYFMDGGRAWSFGAAFQPLSTPAFSEENVENPRLNGYPLPVFDTPKDQRRREESPIIMHRMSALDFMVLHFTHFEERDQQPLLKRKRVNGVDDMEDPLFAPLQCLQPIDEEDANSSVGEGEEEVVTCGGTWKTAFTTPRNPPPAPTVELPPEDLALLRGLFQEGTDGWDMMRLPNAIYHQGY